MKGFAAQARALMDAARAEQVLDGLDHGTSVDAKHWGGYCLWRAPGWDPRRLGGAPALLDRAVAADSKDADARAWRGRVKRLLGDYSGARADLRAAVRLAPKHAYARAALAELDRSQADRGWEEEFERARRADPSLPWTYLWRAAGSLSEGRLSEAGRDLEAAGAAGRGLFVGRVLAGLLATRLKDHVAARGQFDAAAALDPQCPAPVVLRGQARLWAGDERGAVADFEAAVRIDHDCKVAYYSFLGTGDLPDTPEGLAALDAAVRERPKAPWVWALRGELKRMPNLARYDEAIADLQRAVSLAPRSPWLNAFLGRALGNTGRGAEGLAALEKALALDPDCGWIHGWRGEALRKARRYKDSEAALTRSVALSPGYMHAWAWRGTVRRQLRRPKEALGDLDRALDLNPLYDLAYHNRALARLESGDAAGAMEDMERAARMNPKYAFFDGAPAGREAEAEAVLKRLSAAAKKDKSGRALAWRGETKLKTGDLAGALADLAAAARKAPSFAWGRAWHGEALTRAGRFDEALRELDAAVRADADYARAWAWKGAAEAALGRPEAAVKALDASLELDAKSAWAFAWRAEAKRRLGDEAAAVDDFSRALMLDPRNVEARLGRAESLRALGRGAEGLAEAEKALAAAPRDPRARVARALALQGVGRHEESLFEFAAAASYAPDLLAPEPRAALTAQLSALAARQLGLDAAKAKDAATAAAAADQTAVAPRLLLCEAKRRLGEPGALSWLSAAHALGEYGVWCYLTGSYAHWEDLLGRVASGPGALGARAMLGDRTYETLLTTLASVAGPDPLPAWALRMSGEARFKTGDHEGAARDLAAAVKLSPSDAKAWAWLGEARWRLGDTKGALAALGRAASAAPSDAGVRAWYAQVALRAGKTALAEAELKIALKVSPQNAWAHGWMGVCRFLRGDAAGARRWLDKGLGLDPRDVEARVWRAEVLETLGETAAARADLDEALRLFPNHLWGLVGRFLLTGSKKDLEALKRDERAASLRGPDPAAAARALRAAHPGDRAA